MTTLVKNVQLVDGSGKPPFKADVLIHNGKISAIGNFPTYKAHETIEGFGAYLAPGFIDINNNADHYLTLFSNPSQKDYLLEGVTTIIGGQCGASLAPLLYGSLESIKDWVDVGKMNIGWHTVKEFLEILSGLKFGVNFGTLVGHRTIRQALVGDLKRDLSGNELKVFNLILNRALKDGAFGFSTGLGYVHAKQTSYSEIKSLVETVAKNKALYTTHLRNEKRELLQSVNETINIAKETEAKVLINHFRPLSGYDTDYEEAIDLINKNSDKADICFNIYPSDISAVLIHDILPEWVKKGDTENILKDIETPGFREKIMRELSRFKAEETIILNAPLNAYLNGKSLKEFSDNRGLKPTEGILELMKITGLRAVILYKNVSLKKNINAIRNDRAIVASNNIPKTFTGLLKLAEKERILPIETAIYKITGFPAQRLGLKNRGLLKEGFIADLTLFKDAQIREVIINGKRAVKNGVFEEILAGKILKHEI
ncbi:MAG: amidohydrolase family protein [Spirochaetota bacterium]